MKSRFILLLLVWLFGLGIAKAQNVEYTAEVDTNYIMIGDQIHFRMKVLAEPGVKVNFPDFRDTLIKGIEIVSGPTRDSVKEKDGRILFEESYVITSFDTGVYVLPSIPIQVLREDYNNVLRTDPVNLIVNTYVVDVQKGYNDIVMPKDAPWTFSEILPYVLWGLLIVAVIALAWWLILKRKRREPIFAAVKPTIPPYDLAIKTLDEIKKEKLWQSGKVKEYYTQLTNAIRTYLNGELGISAMEQTSLEILRDLDKNDKVSKEQREKLALMFETADFVKFAKAEPLPDENVNNLEIAYGFVNVTNDTVKELAEKARQAEEAKREAEREHADQDTLAKEDADKHLNNEDK